MNRFLNLNSNYNIFSLKAKNCSSYCRHVFFLLMKKPQNLEFFLHEKSALITLLKTCEIFDALKYPLKNWVDFVNLTKIKHGYRYFLKPFLVLYEQIDVC